MGFCRHWTVCKERHVQDTQVKCKLNLCLVFVNIWFRGPFLRVWRRGVDDLYINNILVTTKVT